jgi:hypothetical protein
MSRKDNEVKRMRDRNKKNMEHSATIKCFVASMNSFAKQKNDKSLPLPQRQEAAIAVKMLDRKISTRIKQIEALNKQWS